MGDHMTVFRSLCELFPQVDPRMLKAVAIEHHNDADSAVVAVLDEVMPSSVGISSVDHESAVFNEDLVRNFSAHGVRETGSSSSAGSIGTSSLHHGPGVIVDDLVRNLSANHSVREVGSSSAAGYNVRDEANGSVDSARCTSSTEIIADMQENVVVGSKTSAPVPNSEVSPELLCTEKDAFASALDFPIPDIRESFVGSSAVLVQKDENSANIDYNTQQSGDIIEHGDTFLSSQSDLIPDLNSNHFVSMASTHSSQSVSIESLEDSIADAKNKKNDLLPSLQLVTKMIEDVELLEEKAEVAKRESSTSGASILTKVEELKEMLNHAKEANDMHAGEVYGERSILTTEARELQSRLQRLSEERNNYLDVIEEIRQTLEERLAAAQLEYEAAEKEKVKKEASAQALLSKQEKEMNSIVEESRKLQKEAEENLKLKDFLVERGRIVDTLQGEMAVICEDVSQLKLMVDERLSWSKLQRSTISSLSSSLHSSLHKSGSSSDRTIEAVEATYKHTVAEGARPGVEDPAVGERMVEMLDGCDNESASWVVEDDSKHKGSNEDGWEILN
ncbi:hypothetical protein ACQ4PT_019335 [Festuca glaucescens]